MFFPLAARRPHEDKYYSMPVINWCKTCILRLPPLVQRLPPVFTCIQGNKVLQRRKRRRYTWKAIIYPGSNCFPTPPWSLSWILRSLEWRISSFYPSSFIPGVISLLSAPANRKPPSFQVLLETCFGISQRVCAGRNASAFARKSKRERDASEKQRLTGERRSTVVAFHQGIRGKQKG